MVTRQGNLFDVKKTRTSNHEQNKQEKKELLVSLARERSPQLFIMLQEANYSIFELMNQKEKTEIWQNISDDFDFLIQLIVGNRADVFPDKAFSLDFLSRFWDKLTDADSIFFVKSQYYRDGMKSFLSSEKYREVITKKIGKNFYLEVVKSIGH